MVEDEIQATVRDVIEKQRRFFNQGETRSYDFRIAALIKLEESLVLHRDDILDALFTDLRKPNVEAFVAEYHFLLEELRLIRKSLKKWLKPQRVSSPFYLQPCRSEIRREPFGVALVIAPWNYPIQLSFSPLVAAVAAGNTVILKPSEISTASEELIAKIIKEVFSAEHVAVITGDAVVSKVLLDEPFDYIFFTGSTAIGKIVAEKAAKNLTPCVLELGGKCPAVVEKSADLEIAAQRILTGKFFNGGQTCFAPDFIAVHEPVYEELCAELQKVMSGFIWHEEMAHVINARNYERLRGLLDSKYTVIQQGEDHPAEQKMAPRILTDVNWTDEIMQKEVFGPILPIVKYQKDGELIEHLQSYGSPLALYIFSNDKGFTEKVLSRVRSGGVCINDTMKQGAHLKLPFGGVGESGYGRYRGKAGVEALSYERAVVKKPLWSPDWFDPRPPYGDKIKWMKRFMR